MGQGSRDGNRGAINFDIGEPFSGNPSLAPGLPRPIGWRVRQPDGSAGYDKIGPLDTDWAPVGAGGVASVAGRSPIFVDNTDPKNPIVELGNASVVPSTDLKLWLKGDVGLTATDWLDQSGNHFDANEVVGAPFLTAINGIPALTIDNANGLKRTTASIFPIETIFTVVAVMRPTNSEGGVPFIMSGDLGAGVGMITYGTPKSQRAGFPSTGSAVCTDGIVNYGGIPIIADFLGDTSAVSASVNGAARPTGVFTALSGPSGYALGLFDNFFIAATGRHDLGELLVWHRKLTAGELAAVRTYLSEKWQISLVPIRPAVQSVTGASVDNTDTANPIVDAPTTAAMNAAIAAAVAPKVDSTRAINTTAPLTGGGDLSADRTLAISPATSIAPGSQSAADFAKLATVPAGDGLTFSTESAEIDLRTVGSNVVILPAQGAGKGIVYQQIRFIVTQRTGSVSTAPSVKMGTNGAHDNFAGAVAMGSVTGFNLLPAPMAIAASPSFGIQQILESTADLVAEVVTADAGTSVFKGKFVWLWSLVPFPV